ncbi:hypothetical protein [Sphingomonas solaris]|uniref:Uncharacterized protein n=1 Tax=Alterirhizorhabdus solaris TaxID=2529389 RepID=A0A558R870_9SPHN|nr:hypothetical protein [Sphingomonas solaris]TVV75580.1 hypothetical protein FOY91_06885 [Sphingomonas solaris]
MNDTLQTALTILIYAVLLLGLIGLVAGTVLWVRFGRELGRERAQHVEEFRARRDAVEEPSKRHRGAGRFKL